MNNRQQNRQFDEAIRRIESVLGRKLSMDERRRLHDEITKQGLKTIDEIVSWGLALFPE
ncbi:MAG TPA: hypothetical protein VE377_23745 [Candidatus Dormibacteraeota bacterium]|nr:hypothetical protein [Candidatus Dormibacteraeota bacterium]